MKKVFEHSLVYVILTIIGSILLWYFSFNLLYYPKEYESLEVFYAGTINSYSIENDSLKDLKDDNLRKIEVVSCDPTSITFDTKYDVVCLNNCDIAILPIDILDKTECSSCFVALSNSFGLEYYSQEGTNYGLILNNKDSLKKYFNFTSSDYAIVIVASSVNYGDSSNNSYRLIEWLVNYGNV